MKITNKSAFFHYEILERLIAGIQLLGWEAKSVRQGRMQLKGAYVRLKQGQAWLVNAYIPPYQAGQKQEPDARRDRRLLLTKKQLLYLQQKLQTKGITLVPLSVFSQNNLVKLEIALARGKKKYDKKEALKKRDWRRASQRAFKQV